MDRNATRKPKPIFSRFTNKSLINLEYLEILTDMTINVWASQTHLEHRLGHKASIKENCPNYVQAVKFCLSLWMGLPVPASSIKHHAYKELISNPIRNELI